MYDSLSPLSSVTRSNFAWAFMIDHVKYVLPASNFAADVGTIGSVISSTRDNSIVICMNLIGRYFRWLKIPLNGLNVAVCDDDTELHLRYAGETFTLSICVIQMISKNPSA